MRQFHPTDPGKP